MKKLLLLIFITLPLLTQAQIIAGVAPQGTHIVYPNLTITAIQNLQDSLDLDIDCDSVADFRILLTKGNPTIDFPNTAYIIRVDSNIEFCTADTLQFPYTYVSWYELGDTMTCPIFYSWKKPGSYYQLASNGGFGTLGPEGNGGLVMDSFIVFRKFVGTSYRIGWVNLSTYLPYTNNSNPYIIFKSYTAFCTPNSTINYNKSNLFKLYPTLTEGKINLLSQDNHFKIEIINQVGQSVYTKEFNTSGQHNIPMYEFANGHYFVRYESEKGSQVIRIQKN